MNCWMRSSCSHTYLTTYLWKSLAISVTEAPHILATLWPLTVYGPVTESPHGPRLISLICRILHFVYVQCHLFMPDAYFFSVGCFKASDRARTALNLQGGRRHLERLEILSGLFVGYGSRPPLMGGCLISPCFHDSRAIPLPYGLGYHIQQNFCLHFSLFDSVLLRLANVAECFLKKQASPLGTGNNMYTWPTTLRRRDRTWPLNHTPGS